MSLSFPIARLSQDIREVVGAPSGPLPLHVPCYGASANTYVKECVDTGWVSSVGKFVDQFERDLESLTGAKRAIATVNGTSALHIALLICGVEPDTEVLCPSLTFVATANAITYCNAAPHFVDVEDRTLGVDAEKLREYLSSATEQRDGKCFNVQTGKRVSALIAMHAFGHPFEVDSILSVCNDFSIPLVEDAAESIGSSFNGKHTGTFGAAGILSFNGNKTVTTGGGGAILTNSPEMADRAKHLTTTGKVPHPFRFLHDTVAYNYRMPNINAALGISQLEDLAEILQYKREIAQNYIDRCQSYDEFRVLQEPDGCQSNYWLNTLILSESHANDLEQIIAGLHEQEIFVRTIWEPMHTLTMYQNFPAMNLDATENLARRIINLPSSARLRSAE